MGRWRLQFTPGTAGCSRCGSKTNGDLASPGWFSGQLWCAPCLNDRASLRFAAREHSDYYADADRAVSSVAPVATRAVGASDACNASGEGNDPDAGATPLDGGVGS